MRREQAQRRRADREPVLRGRRPQRERAFERGPLRLRDLLEGAERRTEQLEQARERDPRLRLDPARTQDAHARRSGLLDARIRAASSCRSRPRRPGRGRRFGSAGRRRERHRGHAAPGRDPAACADCTATPLRARIQGPGGPPEAIAGGAAYLRPQSTEGGARDGNRRTGTARHGEAGSVRLPGRGRGRRHPEHRPRGDGRPARAVPGPGRSRAADAVGARRPHRHGRAVRPRVAERTGRGRLRRVRPRERPLHAPAGAGARADRLGQPRVPARASSRSRSVR